MLLMEIWFASWVLLWAWDELRRVLGHELGLLMCCLLFIVMLWCVDVMFVLEGL